jgi:hypothetical protein
MQGGSLQDVKEDVECLRISSQEVARLGNIHFLGLSFSGAIFLRGYLPPRLSSSKADLLGFADALG